MANAIATLCGTVTAVSSAAVGLSFASTGDADALATPAALPPSPSRPAVDSHHASHPLPTVPRSMLESAPSTPARSPPRSLKKRLSSLHDAFTSPSAYHPDTSHPSRPWPARRSTSQSGTASYSSGRDDAVRSNAHSSSSAQPFISPGLVTPPSAPNKLVKRSSSQRGPQSAPPSSFKRFHLKRPATSHQRSATWSMQNFEASRNQDLRPVAAYTDPRPAVKSRHLLQVRNIRRRASHDHETFHIKQIRPSGSTPVLLPASSVAAPEVIVVDESHDLVESRKIPRISASPIPSPLQRLSDDLHTPPKRFLQHHESLRKRTSNSNPPSKLIRRLSKRITSAPVLHSRPPGMDSAHTPPSQSSPLDTVPSGRFAFNESESDASAPTTPTSLPYRLMQRRTRPSVTSSDRTSSRPDSEGGPRVFSWAEGFDEDMNSDTVYDSIRTNTTTKSTSAPPRGALETLFDQSTPSLGQKRAAPHPEAWSPQSDARTPHADQNLPSTPVHRKPSVRVQPEPEILESNWNSSDGPAGAFHGHLEPVNAANADHGLGLSPKDAGLKNSLFDWSEQPSMERGSESGTPPRPKTAHPKKQLDARGGLSAGRRAPSGLHSRSHSVPVLQDLAARQSDASNKFGSWGIGSKGATEAWDNDFDFDEADFVHDDADAMDNDENASITDAKRLSGSMVVPDNIQKQQSNVLANISLLRDWGILIEELKELRARATALGARTQETAVVFDEVDAMVDLADQEVEAEAMPPFRSPASSQTFSEDDFDQITPPRTDSAQRARMSPSEMLRVMQRNKPARTSPRVDSPEAFQRPRQDSEAAARSVIEALQRWRRPAIDGTPSTPPSKAKKVPFDTATLRHIVPHVHGLMRRVKQIVREAEGLNASPDNHQESGEAALRRAFEPHAATDGDESPGALKSQRLQHKGAMSGNRAKRIAVEDEMQVASDMSELTIDEQT